MCPAYRTFFYAHQRRQMMGVRLAKTSDAKEEPRIAE